MQQTTGMSNRDQHEWVSDIEIDQDINVRQQDLFQITDANH